jgi:hypothetical protein
MDPIWTLSGGRAINQTRYGGLRHSNRRKEASKHLKDSSAQPPSFTPDNLFSFSPARNLEPNLPP